MAQPKKFHTEISGTRDIYSAAELDGQLRALLLQHISEAVASAGISSLNLAANQIKFAKQLKDNTSPEFDKLGLAPESMTVQKRAHRRVGAGCADARCGPARPGAVLGRGAAQPKLTLRMLGREGADQLIDQALRGRRVFDADVADVAGAAAGSR